MKNVIRIKVKETQPLATRAEAEAALGRARAMTIKKAALMAEREKARKEADSLHSERIGALDAEIQAEAEALHDWAERNKADFLGLKSLQMDHGVIGWRLGNWTLVKRTKLAWDKLVDSVKQHLGADYVRAVEEVNRQRIIDDREKIAVAQLRSCGLELSRDDAFFIEPKLDQVEPRKMSEAA
jgi:phage host-nuclease inhibitor protein Gam